MKLTKGHIPLYFQFYLQLKQEIVTGEIPPGTRISSIEELYKQYDVSHGTVRRALALLESEGLISKKQRLGTFVRENIDLKLWVPTSSVNEIRERLNIERYIHIHSRWVKMPNRLYSSFVDQKEILKDDRIFWARFLAVGKEDERRKVLSDLYVPYWVTKFISLKDIKRSPLPSLYSDGKAPKIAGFKQIIRPWFCDGESSQYLELPEGTPIFHRTWIPYLKDGRTFYYLENLTTVFALERYIEFKE